MNYVGFPNFASVPDMSQNSTNLVSAKNFFGSGSLGGAYNVGGPSGVNFSGTQGIWAGNQFFSDAPFSVDLYGNLKVSSANVKLVISGPKNNIIGYENGIPSIVIQM